MDYRFQSQLSYFKNRMANILRKLKDGCHPDLLIHYHCNDKSGNISVHRVVLDTLNYFEGLFRRTVLKHHDSLPLLTVEISLPFTFHTFQGIINSIYQLGLSTISDSGNKTEEEDVIDYLNGLYFLGADSDQIQLYLSKLISNISRNQDENKSKTSVLQVAHSFSLAPDCKKKFLARFLYLLSPEEREAIRTDFPEIFPKHYYQESSDHPLIFRDNIAFKRHAIFKIHNHLNYTISTSRREYDDGDHTGFWLSCKPVIENITMDDYKRRILGDKDPCFQEFYGKAIVRIYTGTDVYEKQLLCDDEKWTDYGRRVQGDDPSLLKFPSWFRKDHGDVRSHYGCIMEYHLFHKSAVYEVIVLPE